MNFPHTLFTHSSQWGCEIINANIGYKMSFFDKINDVAIVDALKQAYQWRNIKFLLNS